MEHTVLPADNTMHVSTSFTRWRYHWLLS